MSNFERQGRVAVPMTRMLPRVIGGTCEFCGVMDNKQPSEMQYRLCPHYRTMGELRCSYCPETANNIDVINEREINVHEHPEHKGEWIAVCNSYNCSKAHENRFKLNK